MDRLEQLLLFLQDSPGDSFLLFAIAKEYETAGDTEQALAYYRSLLAADPTYVGTYYHLGKLYERQKQFAEALRIYERGIEVARQAGDRHAWSELAGAKMELEDA